MHEIEQSAGQVIATDTQNSVEAVNRAVISLAHLCASIVEVSDASRLPITTVQAALANAGEGLNRVIGTRDDLGQATRELRKVQNVSTLQTVNFGCPPEYQLMGNAPSRELARQQG